MGTVVLDIVLLTVMASLPAAPNAAELAASTTLQAIGGLWIPAAVLAVLVAMYIFKRDMYRESDPAQSADLGNGSRRSCDGCDDRCHQRRARQPIQSLKKWKSPPRSSIRSSRGRICIRVHCVECHGDDGSVDVIEGVEGLEGEEITPINSTDVLYTLTDSAMYEVIAYGRPNAGMTPFGKTYGGELSKSEIDYIVTFMRYMWDDRFELPAEALKPLFPPLADGEVPSYDVHIAPIVKRYCISCHRAGKDNNNYLMTSYEEILTTGDNKDNNIIAGRPEQLFACRSFREHRSWIPKTRMKN